MKRRRKLAVVVVAAAVVFLCHLHGLHQFVLEGDNGSFCHEEDDETVGKDSSSPNSTFPFVDVAKERANVHVR